MEKTHEQNIQTDRPAGVLPPGGGGGHPLAGRLFVGDRHLRALGQCSAQGASPELRNGWAVLFNDWLARWEKNILSDARNRYCDRETGEEIGWLISPFLNGFYYGYQATHDSKWVDLLMDWAARGSSAE